MWFIWAFLTLLAADPPPVTDPVPTVPPVAVAPAIVGPSATEVLLAATNALAAGDWSEAIRLSAPSISTYPEFATSFRAILEVASEHVGRASPPDEAPVRPTREKSKLAWGYEVGLPTGLRFEYAMRRRAVDSLGLRVGANAVIYFEGITATVDPTFFVDWRLVGRWQLETSVGVLVEYGWVYPQIGAALQYDPKGPLQVNLGARISWFGLVVPDVGVGFVW